MGYFAQVAVATIEERRDCPEPTAEVAIWGFLGDALISWEAHETLPEGGWTALAPGTLFAQTSGSAKPFPEPDAQYQVHLSSAGDDTYAFEFDLHYRYSSREKLLLHVVLPPHWFPIHAEQPVHGRPVFRDRDCYVRVLEEHLALTFFDTARLFVRLDCERRSPADWQRGVRRGVFRVPLMAGLRGALRDWTTDVSAKLISELADR